MNNYIDSSNYESKIAQLNNEIANLKSEMAVNQNINASKLKEIILYIIKTLETNSRSPVSQKLIIDPVTCKLLFNF